VPDYFWCHRDEEYEEVVEDAGPRDTWSLDAIDEAEVGRPRGGPYRHAAENGTGIELFSDRSNQQHDQRGQNEPEVQTLRRDWRHQFGEKENSPQKKVVSTGKNIPGSGGAGSAVIGGCPCGTCRCQIFADNRRSGRPSSSDVPRLDPFRAGAHAGDDPLASRQ